MFIDVYSFKIEVVIVLKMTFKKRQLKYKYRKNLGWLGGLKQRQHSLDFDFKIWPRARRLPGLSRILFFSLKQLWISISVRSAEWQT